MKFADKVETLRTERLDELGVSDVAGVGTGALIGGQDGRYGGGAGYAAGNALAGLAGGNWAARQAAGAIGAKLGGALERWLRAPGKEEKSNPNNPFIGLDDVKKQMDKDPKVKQGVKDYLGL